MGSKRTCGSMENMECCPSRNQRTEVAKVVAITRGMKERARNSKRSNSMARITPAIGVLNVAAIPAPAPQASNTLRSDAVVAMNCPTSEPSAPPVWMMGPSAPNGPPVPMAMAAESGFRMAMTFDFVAAVLGHEADNQTSDNRDDDDPIMEGSVFRTAEMKRPRVI